LVGRLDDYRTLDKFKGSTEVYINIERSTFDTGNGNFTVKLVENLDEI